MKQARIGSVALVVFCCAAMLQPANAVCSTPRLIRSLSYVITPGCEAGHCGSSNSTITDDATGAFWAIGDGDEDLGVGIDNGSYPCLGGWCYIYPSYPAWISTTWSADPGIDGCIDFAADIQRCMAVLIMDNDTNIGTGAFALLTDEPDTFGDYDYSLDGLADINLTTLDAPSITGIVPTGGGTGVEVSVDGVSLAGISGGLYLDPACGSGVIQGYQVFAQELLPGRMPRDNDAAAWTAVGPIVPLGDPSTVSLNCAGSAPVYWHLAFGLVFDSDFGTVWLSGSSPAVECGVECVPSAEVCDGLDNDCDGETDNSPIDTGGACSAGVGECSANGFEVCVAGALECDAVPGSPGAELCDGLDNDCDGTTDNPGGACSAGVGECSANGFEICTAGALECDAVPGSPGAELCDGLDNDCDGTTDNAPTDIGGACSAGVGECSANGFEVCVAGALECDAVPGSPSAELCDGLDNDCDGTTDNPGGACSAGVGECSANGFEVCVAGALECDAVPGSPRAELCDGLDNDCDGTTDNAPTDIGGACSAGVGECSANGFEICTAGALECDAVPGSPGAELCDGLDNDCDGTTDNAPTDIGGACSAGVGECSANGFEICTAGALECDAVPGSPGAELCDGLDNDCDGTTDNAPTDIGGACSAGVGECSANGFEICTAGALECDAVPGSPGAELCDGLDNDCDGTTDNAPTDIGGACSAGVGECSANGFEICTAGALECDAVPGSPGAELCDGLDNDCDGTTDNAPTDIGGACSAGVGECSANGFEICTAGALECDAVPGSPGAELCDGLDNDCDGTTDNAPTDIGGACSAGVGECSANGFEICTAGALECDAVPGSPGAELCDGLDNDCDGTTDNAPTDIGGACSAGVGECSANGFEICTAGALECDAVPGSPGAELCDGLDNDCDGTTDNAPTDIGGACSAGVGECSANGFEICTAGALECDAVPGSPGAELCDGLDNDCDGTTDNAPTDIGGACSAGVGECSANGFEVCVAGALECDAVPGSPSAELCDGLDNDCDGTTDNAPTDIGGACSAGVGECSANGFEICTAGALECDAVPGSPGAELCDGLDNDCDGTTDNAPTDIGGACSAGVGECSANGFEICTAGALECDAVPGSPGAELCDGLDNDCDGTTDNAPTDIGGACSAGVGECSANGFEICTAGALECDAVPGSPGAELCDGLDNDCDGTTDNAPTDIGGACSAGVGECSANGFEICTAGALECDAVPGSPGAELCDGLDNDCDGTTDNAPTDIGGACSAGVGECSANGFEVCVAGALECDAVPGSPRAELCDGLDNDCDGTTDNSPTDIGGACSAGVGECSANGFEICTAGALECDAVPGSPGAELCDGLDNDCDGTTDNSPTDIGGACSAGVGECSANGFEVCVAGALECDAVPGSPSAELCDGLDNDCDGTTDNAPTDIGGACSAGVGECSANGFEVCVAGALECDAVPGSPSAELCDGLDNDCDGVVPAVEIDGDRDGLALCAGDCDDADPATYPGAVEINDALDNQCPGDPGRGFIDEISGTSGFHAPFDTSRFSWEEQAGATRYEVVRSTTPDFSTGVLALDETALVFVVDPETPSVGGVFYYLVRATAPNVGSMGH